MLGGGWLHGKVDELGHLTGDDMMYNYPDPSICLYGTFVKGVMVVDTIVYPQFKIPRMP